MNQVPLLLMELDPTHYQVPPKYYENDVISKEGTWILRAIDKQEDPYDFYEDSLGG